MSTKQAAVKVRAIKVDPADPTAGVPSCLIVDLMVDCPDCGTYQVRFMGHHRRVPKEEGLFLFCGEINEIVNRLHGLTRVRLFLSVSVVQSIVAYATKARIALLPLPGSFGGKRQNFKGLWEMGIY